MKLTLFTGPTEHRTVHCEAGTPLREALAANNIAFYMPCGGNGTCGKCHVEVCLPDKLPHTVLACQYVLTEDCVVRMPKAGGDYSVVTGSVAAGQRHVDSLADESAGTFGIAIDIGTTTIAIQLLRLADNNSAPQLLNTYTCTNPQRMYGADVLSRIQNANSGNLKELTLLIREALTKGFRQLLQDFDVPVASVIIAGNSSMIYFLMEYPCETLGQYPFAAPLTSGTISLAGAFELFPDVSQIANATVTILPGISAFIGGDIVAGLLACRQERLTQHILFIDLGTNGEMALVTEHAVFCTSTAAGPAFEGVNISCGIGSVPGAISHVAFKNSADKVFLQTIPDSAEPPAKVTEGMLTCYPDRTTSISPASTTPAGLCGSGLLDAVAGLLTLPAPVLDETGLLADPYFENGIVLYSDTSGNDIILTQKDIRELQLAKSAIRTGIEILLKRSRLTYDDIDCVYLAGGFGSTLSIESAATIGLIPSELSVKAVAAGNTSLAGAISYLVNKKEAADFINATIHRCIEITLASDPDFQEYFLKYINFPV